MISLQNSLTFSTLSIPNVIVQNVLFTLIFLFINIQHPSNLLLSGYVAEGEITLMKSLYVIT